MGNIKDCREVIEIGKEILSLIDEVPEKGEDFTYSVQEKTEGILNWIVENETYTNKQKESLENMLEGILNWVEN